MDDSFAARAERYRVRAEELRTIAEGMFDQTAKKMLLETATDYLKMADSVEHMGDYKPPPFGKAKPKPPSSDAGSTH